MRLAPSARIPTFPFEAWSNAGLEGPVEQEPPAYLHPCRPCSDSLDDLVSLDGAGCAPAKDWPGRGGDEVSLTECEEGSSASASRRRAGTLNNSIGCSAHIQRLALIRSRLE